MRGRREESDEEGERRAAQSSAAAAEAAREAGEDGAETAMRAGGVEGDGGVTVLVMLALAAGVLAAAACEDMDELQRGLR